MVKFINCKWQAPNLGSMLCKIPFSPSNSNFAVKKCGKDFVCSQYIKKGIKNIFKTVGKKIEIRVPISGESKNLIYVVSRSGCKEEYLG